MQFQIASSFEKYNNIEDDYILIVDDDCFNLIALELNLSKFKKKCLKAYNGEEAIK